MTFPERVARTLREHGYADCIWDSFGRCWSTLGATHIGAHVLFTEVGPRAYNSPNWTPRGIA